MRPSDADLLDRYVRGRCEAAFAELVSRHSGMVYAAACRQGGAGLAEEITQAVFLLLMRKASSLSAGVARGVVLAGWLHRATRYTARNAVRAQRRRRFHERKAGQIAMDRQAADLRAASRRAARAGMTGGDSPWADLAPHLDAAIAGLRPKDRDAVVMRFLEKRTLAEVGAALGLSEHAAQMRVSRAVEKLRSAFGRKGLAVSAVAAAVLLDAHAAPAAPPALAAKLTPTALRAVPHATAALARQTVATVAAEKAKSAVPILVMLAIWIGGGACLVQTLHAHWPTQTTNAAAADQPSGPLSRYSGGGLGRGLGR